MLYGPDLVHWALHTPLLRFPPHGLRPWSVKPVCLHNRWGKKASIFPYVMAFLFRFSSGRVAPADMVIPILASRKIRHENGGAWGAPPWDMRWFDGNGGVDVSRGNARTQMLGQLQFWKGKGFYILG